MRRIFKKKTSVLEEPIEDVLSYMNRHGPDSDEYPELVSHLDRLVRLKQEESNKRISPDTKALIAGNLLGILIIVAYEHGHVLGSRALGFVVKSNQTG